MYLMRIKLKERRLALEKKVEFGETNWILEHWLKRETLFLFNVTYLMLN